LKNRDLPEKTNARQLERQKGVGYEWGYRGDREKRVEREKGVCDCESEF